LGVNIFSMLNTSASSVLQIRNIDPRVTELTLLKLCQECVPGETVLSLRFVEYSTPVRLNPSVNHLSSKWPTSTPVNTQPLRPKTALVKFASDEIASRAHDCMIKRISEVSTPLACGSSHSEMSVSLVNFKQALDSSPISRPEQLPEPDEPESVGLVTLQLLRRRDLRLLERQRAFWRFVRVGPHPSNGSVSMLIQPLIFELDLEQKVELMLLAQQCTDPFLPDTGASASVRPNGALP
jgi:hypothetical protein